MPRFSSYLFCILVPWVVSLGLSSCRDSKSDPSEKKSSSKPSKPKKARKLDKAIVGIDQAIEKFTGAHTRIVWAEYTRLEQADTFANGNELVLKGIDTRDGKSERMIQSKFDNYSRPILSSDGEVILFTDKDVVKKGGKKHYDPDIYRTDWKGSKPRRIAEGYAVDCLYDPATGREWVYAVRHFLASRSLSLEATELVRFPLDDPSKIEVVYDDSRISPDNIQFSRDGTHACGLFPWPHVGLFIRDESGQYHGKKLQTGCWPSMAPDNSGVAWVFDGGHRSASFFAPDGRKPWTVKFNDSPVSKGYEMYHPRWSNHPLFFAISGPYKPVKNASGNVINKGGASANIHLGRFSETLHKVEAWLQITDDRLSESFPDVWIEGADQVNLTAFSKAAPTKEAAAGWPAVSDHLLFLWHDRNALNQFKGSDGRLHTSAQLQARGAARFGRFEEMLVDGGQFEMETEDGTDILDALKASGDVTVEMLLLPAATDADGSATRAIFRGPNLTIAQDTPGHLILMQERAIWRSVSPLPRAPSHLAVTRRQTRLEASVNGAPLVFEPGVVGEPPPSVDSVVFGGGWNGGILAVALYQRALSAAEIATHSAIQMTALANLPPPPSQVKVEARLVEVSAMPTAEGIAPYAGSLVAYVYELEKVLSGKLEAKRILVKHWAMLDQKPLAGYPRQVGNKYDLTLEREDDHPHLKGERVMDDTTAFDLEAWFDVSPPKMP